MTKLSDLFGIFGSGIPSGGTLAEKSTYQEVGTSNIDTSSSSYSDMSDMSITTGESFSGGSILICFNGTTRHSASNASTSYTIGIDGSDEAVTFGASGDNHTEHGDRRANVSFQWIKTGLSSGEHTIKIRWKSSGTSYQDGATFNRVFQVIEL
jgi:hypothetical protein